DVAPEVVGPERAGRARRRERQQRAGARVVWTEQRDEQPEQHDRDEDRQPPGDLAAHPRPADSVLTRGPGREGRRVDGHAVRVRGSSQPPTLSATKFTTTTSIPKTSTIPCTTG